MVEINWKRFHMLALDCGFGSNIPSNSNGRKFPGTPKDAQEKFLRLIKENNTVCRTKGALVTFVTHMTGDKFIRPLDDKPFDDSKSEVMNDEELKNIGWYSSPVLFKRKDLAEPFAIFQQLSKTYGPLRCDSAAKKWTYNALNPNTKSGLDLSENLKETGCETIGIKGGNADVCIFMTALYAASQGYNVIIFTDLTFWDKNPTKAADPAECERIIRETFRRFLAGQERVGILKRDNLLEEGIKINSPNIAEAFNQIIFATSTEVHAAPTVDPMDNYTPGSPLPKPTGPKAQLS